MLSWLFQAFQRQKKAGKSQERQGLQAFPGFPRFLGFFWQGWLFKRHCLSPRVANTSSSTQQP